MTRPRRPGTNRHVRNVVAHAVDQAKATMRGAHDQLGLPAGVGTDWYWDVIRQRRAVEAAGDLWAVARYVTRLEAE